MFNTNQKPTFKPAGYEEPREHGRVGTVIGEGARIQGTINVNGSLRIDGEIEGGHVVTSESLSVGAKGSIKADLTVKQALISGTVVGKIRARERVELLAGAHVRGDVYAQSFKIEDGVFFHGTCIMGDPAASELEAASAAIKAAQSGGSKATAPAPGAAKTGAPAPIATAANKAMSDQGAPRPAIEKQAA